ncbi:MAG: hypothetical protein CO108_13640 [Deltaproteobacteria bacterium CG_4_9_14_3_um_filter_63_12]|nr:MAG: hypothetical protein CO108_13640 [Deltaproteobacteria bacterium CG_4_9_14_3_um_filter_63_12]
MFQLKMSAAIFVVVLALMGFAYFALTDNVTESIVRSETSELSMARRSVSDLRRIAELSLVAHVAPLAQEPFVIEQFSELRKMAADAESIDPLKRQKNRLKLFNFLIDWIEQYKKDLNTRLPSVNMADGEALHEAALTRPLEDWWGTAPDLVLAFVATPLRNSTGHVLVAHASRGQELQGGLNYAESLQVLVTAEETQKPAIDVVIWNDYEYLVVAAPCFDTEGFLVGTVVIGYQLGNGIVERLSSVVGDERLVLVYSVYHGERLYALDSTKVKDSFFDAPFRAVVIDDESAAIDFSSDVKFADLDPDKTYHTKIEGHQYLLQQQAWLSDPTGPRVGFFVLTDYEATIKPVTDLKWQIPLVGAVILVVALIITLIIIRSFLKPLEDIDVGIQEILATSNKEYIFRARAGNSLHAELVNSLNHLTAFLQGKAAPGDADQAWEELLVDLEPERPSIYGMQAVQVVASQEERDSLRGLYDDYMNKRKELNQHVDMDFDRFCRRIKRNEASLKEKHKAKSIEFSVAVADGKVVLKPTPIFD